MGMNDKPSTMITDGPAKDQPATLFPRRMRRLAARATGASSRVVAISPPPAQLRLRAWPERVRDAASVRKPSPSLLLSFSLGCADIRTDSCARQGHFWSFALLPERLQRQIHLDARQPGQP